MALNKFAEETGVAVVVVHPLRKSLADNDSLDRVSRSEGIAGTTARYRLETIASPTSPGFPSAVSEWGQGS